MNDFHYAQKGRSVFGLFATTVVAVLALGFFLSGSFPFQLLSFGLLILVISGIYSILKGEQWVIGVKESAFHWSYPRWPRSSGTIDLDKVRRVVIDDASGWLEFHLDGGCSQRIRLAGGAYKLNDFLRYHFPRIIVEMIEN